MSVLFQDREQAGQELAKELEETLKKNEKIDLSKASNEIIVLAIPRGGIILGDIIAKHFQCGLDVVISRKIRAEFNEEFAIGAMMPDGSYFLNEEITKLFNISQAYLKKEIDFQKKEIKRRLIEFRGDVSYHDKFEGKVVVLVDDGIATGSTIIASAQWVKNNCNCKQLFIAVPVAPSRDETVNKLAKIADNVVILHMEEVFSAVGQFYRYFDQVSDETVKKIMMKRHFDK
ncbi:MAG TPA: phosphoribosyltransferase family protein [Candidatus Nitrosocosmicus sp.]|jgi:putative phosphoribosyl transferase|nr:phosphoribosyltransferase family protein [Candidatus Nitrosocosmicus sp.]